MDVLRYVGTVMALTAGIWAVACSSGEPGAQATVTPITTVRAQDVEGSVRVAVLAIRSAVAANAQYGPIIAYLEESLGRPFSLVPVGQEEQFAVVEAGDVDFTFNNPLSAVQLRRLYGTEFLATLSRVNGGPYFSSVIVARPDGEIERLEDVRGKRVTCVAFQTAAGGCNFQLFHLLERNISSEDFASFTETPSQDNIVLSVLNGTFDVGFVRTGQIERMVSEGTLLSMDEVKILEPTDDDFFFPHTTRLYPEWPLASLPGTDPALAGEVREALLALSDDHPSMVNAGATGFVPAVDYAPIDAMIEALQLRSWDATNAAAR